MKRSAFRIALVCVEKGLFIYYSGTVRIIQIEFQIIYLLLPNKNIKFVLVYIYISKELKKKS